jgi:hypothetical protein
VDKITTAAVISRNNDWFSRESFLLSDPNKIGSRSTEAEDIRQSNEC